MIAAFADAVPAALCATIIERFEADPRKAPGRVEGTGTQKHSTDLGITRLPEWALLVAKLHLAVLASAQRYRDAQPAFARVVRELRHTGYQIQRYLPGGADRFDWHADAVSPATAHRVLALVLYLNTVTTGGETEFATPARAVQPLVGTALWFPPSFPYLHRGRPPLSGPKYVVTTFLVD